MFLNAAEHLEPGGNFVVEVIPPQVLRRPRAVTHPQVFAMNEDRIAVDTFDPVGQGTTGGGRYVRYVYPSELDLMARVAGMRVKTRWAGWDRAPFTSSSPNQVAVFEKLTAL